MLLFPVSPHHLLSEDNDKILKECEKREDFTTYFPQLFLFKDFASLVSGGDFLKYKTEC